jgi:hypothetical protein
MSTAPFPYAGLLDLLQRSDESATATEASAALPATLRSLLLTSDGAWTPAAASFASLLKARKATLQAAADTALAADELRRYQKFAKPGKPSPHIVQLRQKQAAARQATSTTRQALIKAAMVFVRDADIHVPDRQPLDAFIVGWIEANVPKDIQQTQV